MAQCFLREIGAEEAINITRAKMMKVSPAFNGRDLAGWAGPSRV